MRESYEGANVYVDKTWKEQQRSAVPYHDKCFICGSQDHWARWHQTGENGQGFADDQGGPQWLYIAELSGTNDSLYKIGRSLCPSDRIATLQRRNGESYNLLDQVWVQGDGSKAEEQVHRLLRRHRVHRPMTNGGSEWFKCALHLIR
jgi:hypothetical protein|tara:strand:- start:166 stop:606 length:441 start_codon:yes stop_codon:yes gene_type:complete